MPLLLASCLRRSNRGISAGLQLTIFIFGSLGQKLESFFSEKKLFFGGLRTHARDSGLARRNNNKEEIYHEPHEPTRK